MKKRKLVISPFVIFIVLGLLFGGVAGAQPLFGEKKDFGRAGDYVTDEIIVKFKGDLEPFRVMKVPQGKVGEKVREYLQRKEVEYAEPNYIATTFMVPNDPYYSYQWHLDNSVYGGIHMEGAWDVSQGSGVTVAVIDTGIAY